MRNRIRSRAARATLITQALVVSAWRAIGWGRRPKQGPTSLSARRTSANGTIVAEIYAQVLEANGYTVARAFSLGSRGGQPGAQERRDRPAGGYTGTLLIFEGVSTPDSEETYQALVTELAAEGQGGARRTCAGQERHRSDRGNGGCLSLANGERSCGAQWVRRLRGSGGVPGATALPALFAGGLRSRIRLVPTARRRRAAHRGRPRGGEIPIMALLFTSDGVIAAKGFVLLEDDLNLQPAENIVGDHPRDRGAYGDEFVTLLDSVSAEITTAPGSPKSTSATASTPKTPSAGQR